MKSKLFVLFSLSFILFLHIFGCNKDENPVQTTNQPVANYRVNATLTPSNHNQAKGILFIADDSGEPIAGIGDSNVTAELKWGSNNYPLDSGVSGIITVSSNYISGKEVAASLTMDYTSTMDSANTASMENGVIGFIESMKTSDLSEIIKYDSLVQVVQYFTGNKNDLKNAVRNHWQGSTRKTTSLYVSIFQAVTQASNNQFANMVRSAVAFTDGSESSLNMSKSTLLSYSLVSGVPVFAIGSFYDTAYYNNGPWSDLRSITDTTGGFCYWVYPDSSDYLQNVYGKISRQLYNSYSITINWQGILPQAGTIVKAIITTSYSGLTKSITKSFILL